MTQSREEKLQRLRAWTDMYEQIAKCIAATEPEYQADLCRAFNINPDYVNDCRRRP